MMSETYSCTCHCNPLQVAQRQDSEALEATITRIKAGLDARGVQVGAVYLILCAWLPTVGLPG